MNNPLILCRYLDEQTFVTQLSSETLLFHNVEYPIFYHHKSSMTISSVLVIRSLNGLARIFRKGTGKKSVVEMERQEIVVKPKGGKNNRKSSSWAKRETRIVKNIWRYGFLFNNVFKDM